MELTHAKTVLLCEDDELVLDVTRIMLENDGYQVLSAINGRDALEVAERHDGQIDLVVSDVVMPEMNGKQLVDELQQRYPDLQSLLISGYTADVMDKHDVEPSGANFMQKPYERRELLERVRRLLENG